MPLEWLAQLVTGTADAAFAIDRMGLIVAWNQAAERLFGLSSTEAVGRPCYEILQGIDEARPFCSQHCSVHYALRTNQPLASFDLHVKTSIGRAWCNLTIELIAKPGSIPGYALHVVRLLEVHKLLEQLVRVLSTNERSTQSETAAFLISSGVAATKDLSLTPRENEILRLLARGMVTKEIAKELGRRPATVNNHVQSLLGKLDSHNRLELIARAREAGLV
jgi:PAS domain S-box-containing protein